MLNLKSFIKNRLNKPIESPAPKVAKLEMGDVEYTIVGQGKPILIIHGGGGGYDQAVLMFQRYIPEGYQMICPSRPGYLNTPITTGKSFDKQADALAALLDYLHIPSAVVVSISSGGPILYSFAIRHPNKTKAIVAIDSISGPYPMPEQSGKLAQAFYMSSFGLWLNKKFMVWFPEAMIKNIIKLEGYLDAAHLNERVKSVISSKECLEIITDLMHTMADFKQRAQGTFNDVEQGANLKWFDFSKIDCPALIIHGTHDADVKFHNGVFAFEGLSSRQKDHFWIEYGTHFGFFFAPSAKDAQKKFSDFIRKF